MREVISVIAAGAIGGATNSVLGGINLPIRRSAEDGSWQWDLGAIGTVFVGAVAGFVFWAMNTAGVNFDSETAEPVRIAGALIAGLGGGRLLKQYAENAVQQATVQKSVQTTANLAAVVANPAPPP
ncbi:MAG: hypothetical protein ACYDCQ_01860 [Dehalococcoidia bacterium]